MGEPEWKDPNATAAGFGFDGKAVKDATSVPGKQPDLAETVALPATRISRATPSGFYAVPREPVFPIGTVLINRYEILAQLGEGGMGAVYKAHDREVQRDVALKVIRPELVDAPSLLQRFKQELILARDVTHPNVVRIYDIGEAEGVKFITMEYVQGQDLGSLLKEGGISPQQAAEMMMQVCAGLEAVHKKGIIHRDLKPGNIMIDGNGRAVLMDFGLARSLESDGMTMTQTGALVGTMQYMSPEQAKAESLDTRSDIYTIGLIFYELLTGTSPYASESVIVSLTKRTQERAVPPRTKVPNVPVALSEICSKCLEINPKDRYQTIGDLLTDFEAWKSGRSRSALAGSLRRFQRKIRIGYAIFAAFLAVVVGVLAWFVPRLTIKSAGEHAPVSVLVSDFTNHTGDPSFDGSLEPMFNVALEGAKFVNAFSRGDARKLAAKLPSPTDKLDEQTSRLIAVSQGIGAVVTGAISRRDNGYKISVEALDGTTGKSLATADALVTDKNEVLQALPKLATPIRKALGDSTPEAAQINEVSGAFTASSLEVVHQEALGMEQQYAGKFDDALKAFSRAVELDPDFARAYSGMAAMAFNLDKPKDAEKYMTLAMQHENRMTERERYRNRAVFYATAGNWHKCVDEGEELVKRYPADRVGAFNLATCYAQLRNFPKAVTAGRRALDIVPKGVPQRHNLAFLSSFSGDFQNGEKQARAALELNATSEPSMLALAEAQMGQGNIAAATESYRGLEKLGPSGASIASAGIADVGIYEGRFGDAVQALENGATADLKEKNADAAASKFAAIAYAELSRGQKTKAVAAADKALANSQAISVKFLAARIYAETGHADKAQKLAAALGSELQAEPQAYSKIIQGMLFSQHGNAPQAIKTLTDANNLLDTWMGRFELGRAYLKAGALVEADSEFDRCIRRSGEALEFFMDDAPTYGFLPPVYYYQGKVREGMKNPEFANSYKTYANIRGRSNEDPLLQEVHQKVGQ